MTTPSTRPYAVITGASSGIGLELAREFARNGYDLLINSATPAIEQAGQQLTSLGTQVQSVVADLSTPEGVEQLYAAIQATGRRVDAVVLNAGIGVGGDFARDTSLEKELQLIDLNVRSVVHLTKRVVKDMVAVNEGKILFTSSIASTAPGPFEAVYGASKAFVQSFAQAIRNELKDTGITVTSLMPGPTETNFFHRAGMDNTKVGQGKKDDPAEVAREGFKALMDGDDHVVAGSFKNSAMAGAAKVMSDTAMANVHRKMSKPLEENA